MQLYSLPIMYRRVFFNCSKTKLGNFYHMTFSKSYQTLPNHCLHVSKHLGAIRYFSTNLANLKPTELKEKNVRNVVNYIAGSSGHIDGVLLLELSKVVEVLMLHRVRTKDIKSYSQLLKDHASFVKANLLTKLNFDVSYLLPLIQLTIPVLKLAAKQAQEDCGIIENFPDRISYLCANLNLEVQELIGLIIKHTPMITMKFEKLDSRMKILKNAPISTENIVKDLWIFNYNEKSLNERIFSAQETGFLLKPWLLRCSKKHFNLLITKWEATRDILHGEDKVKYLARKLQCSEDYVQIIMKKNSLLHSTNIIKLEKVIEFLYEKRYTPEEICLFPKVFSSNVETLRTRFDKFQELKGSFPTLPQLSISKLFDYALKNAVKQ